jgi:DNA-binding LytR/AlgR family response regulator
MKVTERPGPTNAPTAVIAEDEPLLVDELAEHLSALWPTLRVVARSSDGVSALHAVEAHAPDIAFLDIHMPRLTGLDVARQIAGRCHVVFLTAFDQHAVHAFEAGAIDYVVKPVTMARLATTVQRLKARISEPPIDLSRMPGLSESRVTATTSHLQWIRSSRGGAVRLLTADEICYFKADGTCTLVVTADSESQIEKTIDELLAELDPDAFWQINRSVIVNVRAIDSVTRSRGNLAVRLRRRTEMLAVSEQYHHLFRGMTMGADVGGCIVEPEPNRILATILFTDIVDSTLRAAELGDQQWRTVLQTFYDVLRCELSRFRGIEINTVGDGMLATFDVPVRAVRCARSIAEAVPLLGVNVRTGLHTGECEMIEKNVGGIAVHTAARVAALAPPGGVLVSHTVKDLVAGSGIRFESRGTHNLKGVPGEWQLFCVTP